MTSSSTRHGAAKHSNPFPFGPPSQLPDMSAILRRKRKTRPQRACHPCRLRKVKCDYQTPCKTCVERDHPELCSKEEDQPPPKRVNAGPSPSYPLHNESEEMWTPSRSEWYQMCSTLSSVERSLQELRQDMAKLLAGPQLVSETLFSSVSGSPELAIPGDGSKDPTAFGLPPNSNTLEDTVYLGGNSVPAMVIALGLDEHQDAVKELLRKSILPVFGLDNESATYPFVDLWGIPHGSTRRIELLTKLLPADADCIQIFRQYRDTAHVIYPGLIDIAQFESDLSVFLTARLTEPYTAQIGGLAKQSVYGRDIHWLGLLFSALASGFQCSNLPRKERQMKSQVYVCCAYECLRIVNYLSHANLVDIQNLLVLGNVISNNMNAGVAWSLLGLTIRLAQSLGLHCELPSSEPGAVQTVKSSIWWQIIWQDSLLSITSDKASSSTVVDYDNQGSGVTNASYIDTMRCLCRIGLNVNRQRAVSRPTNQQLLRIVEDRDKIMDVIECMADHLADVTKCRSIKDQLEFWNLYLHRSYILSELCRPAITYHHRRKEHRNIAVSLRLTCITNLANTVEAFLGLHNITEFASQSWAAVHRSLSSALLLGILGEPTRNERVLGLLSRLVTVMSNILLGVDPSEISAPIARSITALQKLIRPQSNLGVAQSAEEIYGYTGYEFENQTIASVSGPSTVESSPQMLFGEDQESPYSLLNNIIWGDVESFPV